MGAEESAQQWALFAWEKARVKKRRKISHDSAEEKDLINAINRYIEHNKITSLMDVYKKKRIVCISWCPFFDHFRCGPFPWGAMKWCT